MIVSQIWALLGVHKALHFRTANPYLIPLHIVLYTIHMIQEHFDIYQKKGSKVSSSSVPSKDRNVLEKKVK